LSTTSGSVWLGLPLYYQRLDSLDELLGESFAPGSLTPEVLTDARAGTMLSRLSFFQRYPSGLGDNASGHEGAALRGASTSPSVEAEEERLQRRQAEALWQLPEGTLDDVLSCEEGMDLCSCLVDRGMPDGSLTELWNLLTSYVFMHPFGLAEPFSSHCHETQLSHVRSRLGNRSSLYVARDMSQQLPFLLSQAAILAPFTGHGRDPVAVFPLEHTPLYTGTLTSFVGEGAYPYTAVGDVLVEPFAWPGEVLEPVPAGPVTEVKVKRQPHLVNLGQLAEWQAFTTAYVADFQVRPWSKHLPQCTVAAAEKLLPHAPLWTPLGETDERGVPTTTDTAVGDAGIYDDLGHIPLLRRRVSKIVLFDSSAVHDNSSGTDEENLCQMVYTRAAFGQPGCLQPPAPAGASNPEIQKGAVTVFEPSEFQPLWDKVVALHTAGQPAVIRGNFTVVDNAHLGIRGGWKAEVIWVIALPVPAWREALPRRTAQALRPFFPNYFAADMMSRFEMSAVSQFISWMTEKAVLKEVRAMLGEAPAVAHKGAVASVTV